MSTATTAWGADDGSHEDGFLLSTPQIEDPLRPLRHARIAARHLAVHAAVVGVADPVETQLGRAFDIQLSALLRAFHVRDYVLDGFAFAWNAGLASDLRRGSRLPGDSTVGLQGDHRSRPSVLVFRRDNWRTSEPAASEYFVLFLVGESPTFGLHPAAFLTAAKCAAALNDTTGADEIPASEDLDTACTTLFDQKVHTTGDWGLRVVGPAFSGSMESLALSLGSLFETVRAACSPPSGAGDGACFFRQLEVDVTSPSASVKSNARVADWARVLSGDATHIEYTTLAASLEDQLLALCRVPGIARQAREDTERSPESAQQGEKRPDPKVRPDVVVLAEESSFGRGVSELLRSSTFLRKIGCNERFLVRMFPQNIAAVRGEQTRLEEQSNAGVSKLLPPRGRLLPLDLSEVGESIDRPPAYHGRLSSRSDELMLYQAFDALRVFVEPVAVAIVATDVRDRLFLLNEVRKNLPTALPILMEMDFLTSHPDYRDISRGSVVIPNGDTLVMLSRDEGKVLDKRVEDNTDYHVFPSDYSANMFRAALALIDRSHDEAEPSVHEPASAARPFVTTLAGFQEIAGSAKPGSAAGQGSAEEQGGSRKARPPRSVLLAADARLALEGPYYVSVLLFGLWLVASAGWLLRFARAHLVMVSPLRNCNPRKGVKETTSEVPSATAAGVEATGPAADRHRPAVLSARTRLFLSLLLCIIGLTLIVMASFQIFWRNAGESPVKYWSLAHGRDAVALAGLSLAYAALAIAGLWRLTLWQRRYVQFRCTGCIADPAFEGRDGPSTTRHNVLALPAMLAVLLVLVTSFGTQGIITSVDSPLPSMLMTMTLLPVGAWFLGQFWTQARHWSELAVALGSTMEPVAASLGASQGSAEARWPTPSAIGELPQSPYSLEFRTRDLQVLGSQYSDADWQRDTRSLRSGNWPFGNGRTPQFLRWQARLVAEMRYASVAVRSAAWCGILAPTAVLIGLTVYPPYDQRLQTTIAVAMIIAGFLLVMYQALRLERDPLLGRMFTLHGDKLSLGGAFGTLWPKLIAASVILIPVLFPGMQGWLHNLIRSINSLQ